MPSTDFLVIGSGIAGLHFAIKVASSLPDKTVTVVTKGKEIESNSQCAQGGIAMAVAPNDSAAAHVADTLRAGDKQCDLAVVNFVIAEGPKQLDELEGFGASFDKDVSGEYDLGIEGGHSEHRIVHHKDSTGKEIVDALLTKARQMPNVKLLTHHFALDLIMELSLGHFDKGMPITQSCHGAYVLDTHSGRTKCLKAKVTMLATGGAGQIYGHTTNPKIATGDGMAMALRAHAEVSHMEFVQFHPTALYQPGVSPAFLISEAVRGAGAVLRTMDGEAFMGKYDSREGLASRDIVAKAIDTEMKASGDEYVLLDCRHLNQTKFRNSFPNIHKKCSQLGLDLSKDMIPVTPAAHYFCGGIAVDHYGRTSIKHLYACGECACTGLHGANRLASNSLLEALVYAERCHSKAIAEIDDNKTPNRIFDICPKGDISMTSNTKNLIGLYLDELKRTMRTYVGIIRSDDQLAIAQQNICILESKTTALYQSCRLSQELCELRNMVAVAKAVVAQSMAQRQNLGVHWNSDCAG